MPTAKVNLLSLSAADLALQRQTLPLSCTTLHCYGVVVPVLVSFIRYPLSFGDRSSVAAIHPTERTAESHCPYH